MNTQPLIDNELDQENLVALVNAIKILDYHIGDKPINVDFSQFSKAELNHFADVLENQEQATTNEYFAVISALQSNQVQEQAQEQQAEQDQNLVALPALANLFSLAHFVEITIPSTVNIAEQADAKLIADVLQYVVQAMAVRFGGCTLVDGNGAWYSSELGKLVFEPVKIAKSFATGFEQADVTVILDLATYVKSVLSQESVLVNLDGIAYLV